MDVVLDETEVSQNIEIFNHFKNYKNRINEKKQKFNKQIFENTIFFVEIENIRSKKSEILSEAIDINGGKVN